MDRTCRKHGLKDTTEGSERVIGAFGKVQIREERGIQEEHAGADGHGAVIVLDTDPAPRLFLESTKTETGPEVYRDTALPFAGPGTAPAEPVIPERIREMMRLYERGDGSFGKKCRNFYRQGKAMEDYEDDEPWEGSFCQYFPTYHDLSLPQLRGYFTWRSGVRRGEYRPIAASLAYIYLYELLCGIGAASPKDSLRKMREFEEGFLDSGVGDPSMRKNLRRWMLEYAVLHDLPAETARALADPAMLARDRALSVLRTPDAYEDEEVAGALFILAGKEADRSPVIARGGTRGIHLFAEVWRYASEQWRLNGKNLFETCFGGEKVFRWYPLANAISWGISRHADTDYELDENRSFRCRGGRWEERRYEELYFDRTRLRGLLHETDRALRSYLKTGSALRERPDEAWVKPCVEAVIAADRKAQSEAARPKVTIDFSGLERIRQNAEITRDSLLTEEEKGETRPREETARAAAAGSPETATSRGDTSYADEILRSNDAAAGGRKKSTGTDSATAAGSARDTASAGVRMPEGLDGIHAELLSALLRGEAVEARIREMRLMPELVTDTINEAFFALIGDSVLECDGDRIRPVEDYREELAEILGGEKNE